MKLPALVLLACALVLPAAFASTERTGATALPGRAPYPAFAAAGDLAVLFRDDSDRVALAGFRGGRPDYAVHALSGRLLTDAPVLKRDGSGGLWAAWGEDAPAGSEVRLARIHGRQVKTVRVAGAGTDFPVSLDLAFDGAGRPWLAGVFYSDAGYAVRVYPPEPGSGRTISVSKAEIGCLRLAAGRSSIRAFWTVDEGGRSEVRSTRLRETGASGGAETVAVGPADGPILGLQAVPGPDGRIWLVWSGYDGADYEIRIARAPEAGTVEGSTLTANDDADLFPSLSFLPGGAPLVVWQRSSSASGQILARGFSGGAWGPERLLARTQPALSRPVRAVAEAGRVGLAWEETGSLRSAVFEAAALDGFPSPGRAAAASARRPAAGPTETAGLDDAYMGFGDSITYGVIDNVEDPALGYIPRLEALLRARFGSGSIVNEGWPGEITVNGMGRIGVVLDAHPVGTLLLMEGTNDVIFSEITMSSTAFHLERMTAAARDRGVYPVLATIIPRSDWRWPIKFYRDRVYELNGLVRDLARNLRLPLAEQFNAFFDFPESEGGWRSLLSDKVHPTAKGYEVMTGVWFGEVERLPFRPVEPAVERGLRRTLFLRQPVNRLTWSANPRLFDSIILIGYNVYRREDQSTPGETGFLAHCPVGGGAGGFVYVDASIDPARRYSYIVRAVRRDGVEGPPSDAVHD